MTNPNARRGIWASLLGTLGIGVAACAACCEPPLVLAIGLLGASGAAGAILGWWLPIIGALMVISAVLLLVVPKHRPRCRLRDNEPTGCGCPPQQHVTPDGRSTLAP